MQSRLALVGSKLLLETVISAGFLFFYHYQRDGSEFLVSGFHDLCSAVLGSLFIALVTCYIPSWTLAWFCLALLGRLKLRLELILMTAFTTIWVFVWITFFAANWLTITLGSGWLVGSLLVLLFNEKRLRLIE